MKSIRVILLVVIVGGILLLFYVFSRPKTDTGAPPEVRAPGSEDKPPMRVEEKYGFTSDDGGG